MIGPRAWQRPRRHSALVTTSNRPGSLALRRAHHGGPAWLGGRRLMVAGGVLFLIGVLAVWGSMSGVAAKVIIVQQPGGAGVSPTVSLPQDRTTERKLKFATDQIEAKNYNEGVRLLGQILESPQDYFYKPNPTGNHYVSIRQHVKRLLGKLPDEGLKAYRLRYGPPAERMLKEAVDEGDVKKLGAVASRFFHTKSGYEATLLLGEHRLDTGEPLAAALTFTRLADAPSVVRRGYEPELSVKTALAWYLAGKTEQAAKVLDALKKAQPGVLVQIGDREVGLFAAGTDPIRWLQTNLPMRFVARTTAGTEHAMVRHDAARSGAGSSHNADITFAWQKKHYIDWGTDDAANYATEQKPSEQKDVDDGVTAAISSLSQTYRQQNLSPMSALRPLVVGDLVVMRTATKLVALDLRTGKHRWYGGEDETMYDVIRAALSNTNPAPNVRRNIRSVPQQYPQQMLHMAIGQRIFSDNTYGKLSSDGELVYCVEDLNPVFNPYIYNRRLGIQGQSSLKKYNRLRGYGLGKPGPNGKPAGEGVLMWDLGGPKGKPNAKLPGAFFLGPPLPLSGRLFTIAETDGQIALHALAQQAYKNAQGKNRYRVKPLWFQPLCQVEQSIETDIYRQTCGASPAYADGIMVCPTGAGVAVAVDVTSQSLLWAYQYPRDENPYANNLQLRGRIAMPQPTALLRGWADSGLMIAEGKVLLTPRGSKSLHCLNLEDGSLVWRIDRGDSLFVAAVHDGKAVVVGPNYVKAHDLGNSKEVWRKSFPDGLKTAGRGFHHSGVYLLPLDNSHLATVEMKTGELAVREQRALPKDEGNLGNLVCVNGWVISQDLDRVQAFHQVSLQTLMARLEKSPRDPDLLAQLGDLLRQKGRLDEALSYLRRAAEISKSPSHRDKLARALLQGVGEDFGKYRKHLTELDALTDGKQSVALRLQFLRAVSDGHFKLKEYRPALAALIKLTDFDTPDTQLHPLEESLLVRRESWVRAQIAKFQADAPADIRGQIAQQIASRLGGTGDADPTQLRRALRFFGSHAAADQTRQRLAGLLLKRTAPPRLEVESLLLRLERSSDAGQSREAVARLAEFYRTAAEHPRKSHGLPAAEHYYNRLQGDFGDVVCLDGKTGKQLYDAAVARDEQLRAFLNPKSLPAGHVQAQSAALPQQARSSVQAVDIAPTGDDALSGHLQFQYRGGTLYARTGQGRLLWQVSTNGPNNVARPNIAYGHRIMTRGHLVVLSTGFDILGIDASPGITDDAKRIRWVHSLVHRSEGDVSQDLYPNPYYEQMLWGEVKARFRSRQGRPLGLLQPLVGDGQVTFLRGTELISVDALNGEVIWRRSGLEMGSDLFGDDERVFVIGQEQTTANAFRAADGTADGVRQVPHRTQRMAIYGTRVLAWVPQGLGYDLKLIDAQSGKALWTRSLAQTAKATPIGGDEIGIVNDDANGDRRIEVLSLADGAPRFATPANEVKTNPTAIYVIRSRKHYVAAVNTGNSGATRRVGRINIGTPRVSNYWDVPLVTGHVYGFDRHTQKRLWDLDAPGIGLPLHQPPESPLLVFMTTGTNIGGVIRGGIQQGRYITSVAFVDKRRHAGGGRPYVVHKEVITSNLYMVPELDLTVGPGAKVVFKHPVRNITLTFTADKVPATVKNPDLSLDLAALGAQGGQPLPGQAPPAFRAAPAVPRR